MSDSQRIPIKISTAEKQQTLSAPGNKLFVKSTSAPFGLKFGTGNENQADNGMEFDFGAESFNNIVVRNLSTTATLQAVLFVGTARVSFNFPAIPNTEALGWVNFPSGGPTLADGASEEFPGIAGGSAAYSDAGIVEGCRRKYMVIHVKPSLAGKLLVYNKVTGGLLSIIGASSAGGGEPIETSATIIVNNRTGGAVQTSGTTPDISIAEYFYT